jgi:hypothetical protein
MSEYVRLNEASLDCTKRRMLSLALRPTNDVFPNSADQTARPYAKLISNASSQTVCG